LRKLAVFAALAVATLPLAARHLPNGAVASSHREAPLIAQDPVADSTDVYAFVSPDKPNTVTLIANYIGLEAPQSGPNFPRFGDDVQYVIHVDNVGDGQPHVSYYFEFTTTTRNPNTFLYNTGPIKSLDDSNWNVVQTMKVTRVDANGSSVLCDACKTPPVNVGAASTPNYDTLATAAINDLGSDTRVFAGQRADPFFIDLGAVFDLLQVRPADKAVNSLKGTNVHTIAIQVPITAVTNDGMMPASAGAGNAIIGVWTAAYRQSTTVLGGGTVQHSGDFVQVSRLGMPLTNEIIIPVGQKDHWNQVRPASDSQFKSYHDDPEPARLLKLLYNVAIPPTPRSDITAIFLTGVPGLNMPANGVMADELRLNLAIPPSANPNRLGVVGGDTAGFPNGRRLNDDVVDIAIQAVAGATYPLIDKNFTPDPLASKLGDGVDAPDKQPLGTFPYVASPYPGTP
jgi:hypothetical protein